MASLVVQAYLDAIDPVLGLLEAPEVAAAWEQPSVLVGMTVGGLAAHLARAVTATPTYLAQAPEGEPVSAATRLSNTKWVSSGPDSPVNTEIRQQALDEAAAGPDAVAASMRTAARDVRTLVATQDPDRRVVVVPAEGVSVSLDDFVTLRLLELSAHSDDLACSVGLPTPPLPQAAQQAVAHLLVDVAIVRHGWPQVLRALSRAERAPKGGISAFGSN
jgi:hypothetical protein